MYIVENHNNTWKALCSTWVHPSTAPSHQQRVSIWRDSTPSLPFSKGQTPSFYSCKLIRRLLLVFSSHTHASAGFLLLWLHRILTCETRMVFRHTPLLFPHLSSLSKLLHRTVKHPVLTCDTATQHPLKFKLRKTKTLTLWRRRWTLVSWWQLEAAAQRSARWVPDNFTACSNAFEYLRNYPQPGTCNCKAAIKLKDTTTPCLAVLVVKVIVDLARRKMRQAEAPVFKLCERALVDILISRVRAHAHASQAAAAELKNLLSRGARGSALQCCISCNTMIKKLELCCARSPNWYVMDIPQRQATWKLQLVIFQLPTRWQKVGFRLA